MRPKLNDLKEQTIVIAGASSGIGLATARLAAKRKARLVLAARSGHALRQLTDELSAIGREAVAVIADISREEDAQRIGDAAVERFGGFDTWINNAGVSVFGKLLDIPVQDMRRLFETNFWGLVYGSLEAARRLIPTGGAIINVGSTLSDRSIPLQGPYCASKHAVKAFTDTLRMELEADGAPVSVTLIKPGAIDTPYMINAKNYMEVEPKQLPPAYSPATVARTVLHCAETPERDVFIGAGGKAVAVLGQYAPRLTDRMMELIAFDQQKSNHPARALDNNALEHPSERLQERSGAISHAFTSSLYTQATLRPQWAASMLDMSADLAFETVRRVSKLGQLIRPKG
jgi:short-subunit dehydrogenase